jgi:hypothetical protein
MVLPESGEKLALESESEVEERFCEQNPDQASEKQLS